jgi:hypothetical protein
VSLFTDIIQLFGTGSVPAIVAGSVLGVFELGERLASQRAKDALSKWLLSFDIQKARALPEGTQELFERIFGKRHFSLKCFFRSAVFSIGATVFVTIIGLLIFPGSINSLLPFINFESLWLEPVLWIPWAIMIDYLSLFKTRAVLRLLTLTLTMVAIGILIMDFLVYKILFRIGLALNLAEMSLFSTPHLPCPDEPYLDCIKVVVGMAFQTTEEFAWLPLFPAPRGFNGILFWAGFAPSIWMWLYVAALLVTRALLRSEKLVNWLRWFLDVEKAPFRSIGAVAAVLAFIASVAIILVSAEASRMSAAS